MKIKIQSEEELLKVATEALHILANLRHFTKKWNETHGYELKRRKIFYEEKADELIQRLQIEEHRTESQVKIEVNANQNTAQKNQGLENAS